MEERKDYKTRLTDMSQSNRPGKIQDKNIEINYIAILAYDRW